MQNLFVAASSYITLVYLLQTSHTDMYGHISTYILKYIKNACGYIRTVGLGRLMSVSLNALMKLYRWLKIS